MKRLILAVATLSVVLVTSAAYAQRHCNPWCRPVPNGSGGTVTVCTCN